MCLPLLLSSQFFKSWIAWVQQRHVITDDVQDILGVEEDGTNSNNQSHPRSRPASPDRRGPRSGIFASAADRRP
jgi:hypothetical protein